MLSNTTICEVESVFRGTSYVDICVYVFENVYINVPLMYF